MRILLAVAALAFTMPAAAADGGRLDLALLAGGRFPQVMNALQLGFEGDLRVGARPSARLPLAILVELGYARTPKTLSSEDPRLGAAGEPYASDLVLHDLRPGLGVEWRLALRSARLLPYVGATARLHLFRTDVEGAASGEFGAYSETATAAGGSVFGGLRVALGPGALLSELALSYVPVAQRTTGDSNAGALALRLGYALSF